MHPPKAAGLTADSTTQEARRGDLLGRRIDAEAITAAPWAQALRATIIGSNQATANGVTVRGHAPVLALCRALIEAGVDPSTPLEAYRGSTLCLRVRSIGEGARLTVQDSKTGRPRFVRFQQEGSDGCVAGPYVEQALGEVAA
jgi:hypothetical protein